MNTHMNTIMKTTLATALASLTTHANAQLAPLDGAYAADRWVVAQGGGLADDDPVLTRALRCDYELTDNNGDFSPTIASFDMIAPETTTVTFAYDYRGDHGLNALTELEVYKTGPGGLVTVDLVPGGTVTDGPFEFSGTASFDVDAGDLWGVRVIPQDRSGGSTVSGALVLFNFNKFFEGDYDRANWGTSINPLGVPAEEVTGPMTMTDAPEIRYDSGVGPFGSGSPCTAGTNAYRIERFNFRNYAAADGGAAQFNWSYAYDHGSVSEYAQVSLQDGSSTVEAASRCGVGEMLTGTSQVDLSYGALFGIRLSAQHADNNGGNPPRLLGAATIWGLETIAPTACSVADVNTTNTNPGDAGYGEGDGGVDGADLSYYVEQWLAGCP